MNIKASVLYAKRILFPKEKETSVGRKSLLGSVFCIGISLIPLVVVLTISEGMIKGITERIISLSSSHIEAVYDLYNSPNIPKEKMLVDAKNILNIPGVVSSFPMIECSSLVAGKNGRTGSLIRSIPEDVFKNNESFKTLFSSEKGNIENFYLNKGKHALIGKGIAEKLNVLPGDSIYLITTKTEKHGRSKKVQPKFTRFQIDAIVSCGYQELDSLWVFIPFEEGVKIISPETAIASIRIETADAFSSSLENIKSEIDSYFKQELNVYKWNELNRGEYENFASTKMLLLLIMLLIVLVAAVNISSALIMVVMERQKEIAILKSLGASENGISLAFLIIGFVSGLCGVLIGIPFGLLCAVNINGIISFIEKVINFLSQFFYLLFTGDAHSFSQIHLLNSAYYLQEIPVDIAFKDLFIIVSGTLILSLIVSIIPSHKAGKERPLDTFRKVR